MIVENQSGKRGEYQAITKSVEGKTIKGPLRYSVDEMVMFSHPSIIDERPLTKVSSTFHVVVILGSLAGIAYLLSR